MADDLKTRAESIRTTSYNFCKAFAAGDPPSQNLNKYFTADPRILEHGPAFAADLLPFLGIAFQGRRSKSGTNKTSPMTCDDYYQLLTSILSFRPDESTVPPKDEFMVDAERGTVTVKLHSKFASVKTGKSWEEDFVYILSEFDNEGKIGSQELWADPLSAYLAVQQ